MAPDLFCVEDRTVVVTGGLGQLGRQFSLALVEGGARVAVLDVLVNEQQVFARFGEACRHDNLLFLPVNVAHRPSIEAALLQVVNRWGVPHALINNAALDSPPDAPAEENGPFETYPDSSWDKVMEINAKGAFLCCQVIGGRMAEAGRGSIINIGSIYGLVSPDQRIYRYRHDAGAPFFKPVSYSVSKSALLSLTRYLATYWAARNVRVNTLVFAGVYNNQSEEFLASYCSRVPLGRMARADEYNGAVVFLVSDASSYMTGSTMVMDGGWTAW